MLKKCLLFALTLVIAVLIGQSGIASDVHSYTPDYTRIYAESVSLFERGEYSRAAKLFIEVIGYEDSAKYLWYAQGKLLLDSDMPSSAIKCYEALSGTDFLDSDQMLLYSFARDYENGDYYSSAAEAYRRSGVLDSAERAEYMDEQSAIHGESYAPIDDSIQEPAAAEATPAPTPDPTPAMYKVLQRNGGNKKEVSELQTRLVELGYLAGSVDGAFGQMTQTAVEYFQASAGLEVTGIADAVTQQRLYGGDAPRAGDVVITPESVEINYEEKSVKVGGSVTLTLTAKPVYANAPRVRWVSEDESIATVDENGKVNGVKSGSTSVYAEDGEGSRYVCKVIVYVETRSDPEPKANPTKKPRKF